MTAGQRGMSLVELLAATAIAALLLAALAGAVQAFGNAAADSETRIARLRDATHALDMLAGLARAGAVLEAPRPDDPDSAADESVRDLLVLRVDGVFDRDGDGLDDGDDDGDGASGEDPGQDVDGDGDHGVSGVDDDGDGSVDEPHAETTADPAQAGNDDEDQTGALVTAVVDEDPVDGVDNDFDDAIDEDPGADADGDGCPGWCGVDDDGDGRIDEGSSADDDEDGASDEDPARIVVVRLAGDVLQLHYGLETGAVPVEVDLLTGATAFSARRIATPGARAALLRLDLAWDRGDGNPSTLGVTLRVRSREWP